jgi:very-short-patch-repair endonuclease
MRCEVHRRYYSSGLGRCPLCASAGGAVVQAPPAAAPAPKKKAQEKRATGQATEDALWAALGAADLADGAEVQFPFAWAYGRKWRADVAYPAHLLLIECEGGCHGIEEKRVRDLERASVAAVLGYRVLRVNRKMVDDGRAVEWVRLCLGSTPR